MKTKIIEVLSAAIFLVLSANQTMKLNESFSIEETQKVAEYVHQELKGAGPILLNGKTIDTGNLANILEEMDELYKVFSIAISSTFPAVISNSANTEAYKIGPLGVLEKSLKDFETISKVQTLEDGTRIATILILNPEHPGEQNLLKSLLEKHSSAYAFSANTTGRPFFQAGQFKVK
ncbi:hypothetical protein [Acinetobacter baumannii]|uniref:hypothetical protein n=1 Tax=Acinetobacter baumannii TaxID=470 RepID=UPI0023000CF0|nr:hypothetical protein [Acinetobacter baumannii]MDA5807197.1 hypothetical protein [Acinetobacter baumannii]